MEKRKILYLITKGNLGGAQKYVYDLAVHANVKDEVVVAFGKNDGSSLEKKLKESGVKTIELKYAHREIGFTNDFLLTKEISDLINKEGPAIVHLNSSKIGLLGSIACLYQKIKGCKIKIIFTAHNWAFNESGRSLLGRFVYYIGHFITLLISDRVITVSLKTERDVANLPFIKNKIITIHNGIEEFENLPKEKARKILLDDTTDTGQVIIISLSELHQNKGLDTAIKSLNLLDGDLKKQVIYFILGDGDERSNLEQLISDLKLKDSVVLKGFVDNAKKLIGGADIFLMPSRNEALPYAILEAGMVGLATIATNVGGVPEIISDMEEGILVHPNNKKEIAEAIKYFKENPDKMFEYGQKLNKKIKEDFSLEKMVMETIRIYDVI